ncbi:MAG: YwiC-like family protein [Hormoscilla sp. GM7CHS1pb]|nr:YwiC-like family protein [Hormoscilla sp. GM7CHS1pb]
MSIATNSHLPKSQQWYRPTVSLQHGVYVMLIVSFLTGAAAAGQWTWATTLAFICAFFGFQAEHPLVLQVKQRKSWKPRFLLWGSIYGGVAGAIALWFAYSSHAVLSLLPIYGGVIAALIFDLVEVWHRQQKSFLNELVTFAAICLSALLAYAITMGTLSTGAIAIWILDALFFSSAIFTVKLRKIKNASIVPGLFFHGIATIIVMLLWLVGWLAPMSALAFGVALLKFALILWQKDWYCTTKIQQVALLETNSSLVFLAMVAIALLWFRG